jgi:hypothetical protein
MVEEVYQQIVNDKQGESEDIPFEFKVEFLFNLYSFFSERGQLTRMQA